MPATIHRMPPAEGLVKWAYLHRKMVGQQEQWRLTFSVSMPGGFPPHPELASSGAVGIDIGWRVMPSGDLRTAYYHGSDGEHQAVQLPPEVLSGFRIIDSIQGFRKGMFNTVRDALQEFLQGTKGLPEILQEQVESIDKWKSNRRLAHLVSFWRQHRDDLRTIGDRSAPQPLLAWAQGEAKRILEIDRVRRLEGATERLLSSQRRKSLTSVARSELSVYEVLHFWASRENHLFEYEAHGRQQLAAKRLDHYRVVAAALRRSYSTVVLEGDEKGEVDKDGKLKLMDLTKFGAKAPPEGDEVQRKEQRRVARLAAPGEFRQVLVQTGMQVVPIQAAYTSSDCPRCHHRNDYNRARLYFVCAGCGERHDHLPVNACQVVRFADLRTS